MRERETVYRQKEINKLYCVCMGKRERERKRESERWRKECVCVCVERRDGKRERKREQLSSRGRLTLVVAMCACVCVCVPTCSAHFYLFKEIKERISEVLVFLSIECARWRWCSCSIEEYTFFVDPSRLSQKSVKHFFLPFSFSTSATKISTVHQ